MESEGLGKGDKCGAGEDHKQNEDDGTYLAIDILPEEVWEEIFSYLKPVEGDPRDIINLAQTCTLFDQLLLEITPACRLEEVIPFVLKWIQLPDILNCRLVCKRVGQSVDKILNQVKRISRYTSLELFPRLVPPQSSPPRQESFEWEHFKTLQKFRGVYIPALGKMEEFQRYLEEARLNNHSGQVIVGNSMEIWPRQEVLELLSCLIYGFLDRLGTAIRNQLNFVARAIDFYGTFPNTWIRYLDVGLTTPCDFPRHMYFILEALIRVLPNLRCLKIAITRKDYDRWLSPGEVTREELERYLQDKPLPVAPHLEKLEIRTSFLPFPIFREIATRYSGHLKTLALELAEDPLLWEPEEEPHRHIFPVLLELSLWFPSQAQPFVTRIDAPRLKMLQVTVRPPFPSPDLLSSAAQPLAIIQNFPSISKLAFNFMQDFTLDRSDALDGLGENVRHPNLKHVQFWHCSLPWSFFTRLCPNLESLKIFLRIQDFNADIPDLILIREKRMMESMLWREAVKLQKIISVKTTELNLHMTFTSSERELLSSRTFVRPAEAE